jgi:NADPH:quinone reductase-like Zn-dependent oxidoreductase
MIRSGAFPLLGDPPFILGWDIAGTVAQVVPGTGRFQPDDEVFGVPFFPRAAAGNAEYIAAPRRMLARKPTSLDHVHAAALPLAGLIAWQGLVEYANVAFDVIGGDYGPRSLRSLRPGGVFVTAVDRSNAELAAKTEAAGRRFVGVAVEPDYVGLEKLGEFVDAGLLRPHVEHVLALTAAGKAHHLAESGHTKGKIVFTV